MSSSSNGRQASGESLDVVDATSAAERRRQAEARQQEPWWRWGPYLSERQWGTVREDYSKWRGPIWMPINFLLVEAVRKFHHSYGEDFLVDCPTGSGNKLTLWQIAAEIWRRLESIFLPGPEDRRPVFGHAELFQTNPHWRDHVPFHEYLHGDSGRGVGASHQTGRTGVVAKQLEQTATQMAAPRGNSAGAPPNTSDVHGVEAVAR